MKRLALTLACLIGALVLALDPAPTSASPFSKHGGPAGLKVLGGVPGIPQEWAGQWSVTDSTYFTCLYLFQGVTTSIDTLCTGQTAEPDTAGLGFSINCSGTATATTIDYTCTGTGPADSCTVTFEFHVVGTRTADTYDLVTTTSFQTTGPGDCALIPEFCFRVASHGTRIGPELPAYCATPARDETWGRLKSRYR